MSGEERLRKILAKISQRCSSNKKSLLEFEIFLSGLGYSEDYRYGFMVTLYKLDRFLKGRSFKNADEKEILEFLKNRKPVTRATYATRIKSFYRWLYYGTWRKGKYPRVVENISTSLKKSESSIKSANDILSQEEVLKLIDAANSDRDRCLISMLYDTGARPSEVLGLKIRDIKLNDVYGEIIVDGKTGRRRIPLTFSTPYVRRWLNVHPDKSPDSLLFPKVKLGRGGKDLTPTALNRLLHTCAKRAGINKRVHPYILRHTRLTELANVLREHQLKAFAGWTAGSRMAEVYVKLSGLDLDGPLLEYYGIKKNEEKKPMLSAKKCPRCGRFNPPTVVFCEECQTPIDERALIKQVFEVEDRVRGELESLRRLFSDNIISVVKALAFSNPEAVKNLLKSNPNLLKLFIKEREGDFIAEYCNKKHISVDSYLDKLVADILQNENELERFIKGLIVQNQ